MKYLVGLSLFFSLASLVLSLGNYELPVGGLLTPPGGGILSPGGGVQRSGTNVTLINSGDNVGIGTTSPQTNLEIVNTSGGVTTSPVFLSNLSSATSTASRLTFRANDVGNATSTAAVQGILTQNYGQGTGALSFLTLNAGVLSEVGRFTSTGFLGIGTTTPAQELSVSGDIIQGTAATTSHIIDSGSATAGGCIQFKIPSGGFARLYINSNGVATSSAGTCQ